MKHKTRYWFFQLGGWGSVTLINIFFAYSFDRLDTIHDRNVIFGRLTFFILLGILFTHFMRFILKTFKVLQKSLKLQLLQLLFITVIIAIATSVFHNLLISKFDILTKTEKAFKDDFLLLTLSGSFYFFLYFLIWNLIYFSYHFVSKSQKQQLDTLQLESLVKELELQTIKAHINPHFIFNSMNSIRALIDEDPSRARNAITELSNILRSSLHTEKIETVSFEKELHIVKDYLALEKMRFEDRLQVIYEVETATTTKMVPPMMVQILVENAIKHGISKSISGGEVKISSKIIDNYHVLAVQNTGQLIELIQTETEEGKTFGIPSTIARLRLLYGDKAHFTIKQLNAETVEAKILLPV
ncbi:MAG: sensor histidine kinase [Chitinophagaceae bacterium]|nr:MAG: sensor histidine kinase [Chitinophagaceae bacterium]